MNSNTSNKYEVAPGLYIGSEIGDINREVKVHMKAWLDGDATAHARLQALMHRRVELMLPKELRKK